MREPGILVLARPGDAAVDALRRAMPQRVHHVGPADLSRAGWRYVAGQPQAARAVAEGRVIAADNVAIVCRFECVTEADLPHIAAADRAYAAAEMNAFLLGWLAQHRAACVNPPAPLSLCGPAWHETQWVQMAARAGVPVVDVRQTVDLVPKPGPSAAVREEVDVVVIGERVIGAREQALCASARRVAAVAGMRLLGARFVLVGRRWSFAGADPCPPLDADACAALLALFQAPHPGQDRRWAS